MLHGLGQKSFQWKQLVWTNVELVSLLERIGLDSLGGFDGEKHLVERTQDLVHLAHLAFVLEIYRSIEIWNFDIHRPANNIALT